MYKYKVELSTQTDLMNFTMRAEKLSAQGISVKMENEDGTRHGNATSLLNVVSTLSWNDVYIVSDHDVYMSFRQFIIN